MKERSLVGFTIFCQLAIGSWFVATVFSGLNLWSTSGLSALPEELLRSNLVLRTAAFMGLGLLFSFFHLGKPSNAWRALSNLRSSWLSREILLLLSCLGLLLLNALLTKYWQLSTRAHHLFMDLTVLLGFTLVWAMAQAYRLRTIPSWNTGITTLAFFTTTLLLGVMATLADQALDCMEFIDHSPAIPHALCWTGFILIVGEWILAAAWRSKLINASEAGNRAVIRITQELKPAYRLRWILAWIGTAAAFAATYSSQENTMAAILAILAFELVLASEAASRALFYEARIRHGL